MKQAHKSSKKTGPGDGRLLAMTLLGVVALVGATAWLDWAGLWPDDVLGYATRPLVKAPDHIADASNQTLVKMLRTARGHALDLNDTKLVYRYTRDGEARFRSELDLTRTDPYVFAQREKTGHHTLIAFCSGVERCARQAQVNGTRSEPTMVFLPAGKDKVQDRLEALRELIKRAGGRHTLDSSKNLSRLLLDLESRDDS